MATISGIQNFIWSAVVNATRRDRLVAASLIVLLLFVITALFADLIAPFDPMKTSNDTFQAPSMQCLLGTDDLGRDVLSGVMHGARSSIMFGVLVAIISGLIGVAIGAGAAFAGGFVDDL